MSNKTIHRLSLITTDQLINRGVKYFKAKNNCINENKKRRAEATCVVWLKWAKFYLLTHPEKHFIYKSIFNKNNQPCQKN